MRKWLKNKRLLLRKTQRNVALELGVTQQYYNLIEKGLRQKSLRTDMVCKLSNALNIPIEEIIKNENMQETG